jgi:hypothetical protein
MRGQDCLGYYPFRHEIISSVSKRICLLALFCTFALADRHLLPVITPIGCGPNTEVLGSAERYLAEIKRSDLKAGPHEYRHRGTLLSEDDPLPPQPNGRHLFLIGQDAHGRLLTAVSLRMPDELAPLDGKFLVTHRSLETLFPPGTRFLGAGEYLMVHGKLREISNQSGTYPQGEENFDFSKQFLMKKGLKFEDNTKTLIWSPTQTGLEHRKAEHIARLQLRFAQNPELKQLREKAIVMWNELYSRFRSKEMGEGLTDLRTINDQKEDFLIQKYGEREYGIRMQNTLRFISTCEHDGVEQAIEEYLSIAPIDFIESNGATKERVKKMEAALARFNEYAQDLLH